MPTLELIITDAGHAAIVNETNLGTLPVTITEIALGSGQWTPDATATALQAEIKRVNTIGGLAVAADTIHATITDDSADAYALGEFGLYTDSGVLFAIYSNAITGITDKAAEAALLIASDMKFTSIPAGSVTITGPGFVNPSASEILAGVLEIATQVEADTGTDHTRAITPLTLASILSQYLIAITYNATDVLAKLLTVDGAGSFLDADLLDGIDGSSYRNASNLNAGTLPALRFSDVSHGGRAGSTLHALATTLAHGFMSSSDKSKLNGIENNATADQTAAEIKTAYESNLSTNAFTDTLLAKLNGIENNATADQTAAEILALLLTLDGTLSGLDADVLDGQHGSFYLNASNLNAGTLPATRFSDVAHGARAGGTLHALATTIAHGFMSSSDKSKLNGIEANATADQTAAEILALLKTVDGINSGVDADLFQGANPTQFIENNDIAKKVILNLIALPSATFLDVTSVPSWVRKITISVVELAADINVACICQIGSSGGIETTGYVGSMGFMVDGNIADSIPNTNYFELALGPEPGKTATISITLQLHDETTNTWVATNVYSSFSAGVSASGVGEGSKSLAAPLDRFRISTTIGTGVFTGGSIRVTYE